MKEMMERKWQHDETDLVLAEDEDEEVMTEDGLRYLDAVDL